MINVSLNKSFNSLYKDIKKRLDLFNNTLESKAQDIVDVLVEHEKKEQIKKLEIETFNNYFDFKKSYDGKRKFLKHLKNGFFEVEIGRGMHSLNFEIPLRAKKDFLIKMVAYAKKIIDEEEESIF